MSEEAARKLHSVLCRIREHPSAGWPGGRAHRLRSSALVLPRRTSLSAQSSAWQAKGAGLHRRSQACLGTCA